MDSNDELQLSSRANRALAAQHAVYAEEPLALVVHPSVACP